MGGGGGSNTEHGTIYIYTYIKSTCLTWVEHPRDPVGLTASEVNSPRSRGPNA